MNKNDLTVKELIDWLDQRANDPNLRDRSRFYCALQSMQVGCALELWAFVEGKFYLPVASGEDLKAESEA